MPRRRVTARAPGRATPLDRLLLWLALLQGSSFTLSLALYVESAHTGALAALVSVVWAMGYALAAAGLFAAFGLNWVTWLVRYRLLLTLLLAGALFSAGWSVDPRLSLERGAHLLGTTLLALYLGLRLPLSEILATTARALALLLVLSVLAALFYPAVGIEDYAGRRVWRGVLASKNTLGFWAAIGALLFLSRAALAQPLPARLVQLALAALALLCVVQSVSATSALALVVALLAMGYVHAASSLRLGMLPMTLLAGLVAALAALAFRSIDTAELIGRSGDLTGRAEVWAETWRLVLERPLSGFGYGTIWYPTEASVWIQESLMDINWLVYHAHNGVLQIASELGLPLTVVTLLMLVQQLIEVVWCQYRRRQPGIPFVLGFCVALLVSNYAEARLLLNRDLTWILLIALPSSMLGQVTVPGRAAVPVPMPLPARTLEKIATGRERLAHRRELKRRLRERWVTAPDNGAVVAVQPPPRATARLESGRG